MSPVISQKRFGPCVYFFTDKFQMFLKCSTTPYKEKSQKLTKNVQKFEKIHTYNEKCINN